MSNKFPGVDRPTGERVRIGQSHTPDADTPIPEPEHIRVSDHNAALHQISPAGTRSSRLVPSVDHGDMRKSNGSVTPSTVPEYKRKRIDMTSGGKVPARSTPSSLDDEQFEKGGVVHTTEITPKPGDPTVTHSTEITNMLTPAPDASSLAACMNKAISDLTKKK